MHGHIWEPVETAGMQAKGLLQPDFPSTWFCPRCGVMQFNPSIPGIHVLAYSLRSDRYLTCDEYVVENLLTE